MKNRYLVSIVFHFLSSWFSMRSGLCWIFSFSLTADLGAVLSLGLWLYISLFLSNSCDSMPLPTLFLLSNSLWRAFNVLCLDTSSLIIFLLELWVFLDLLDFRLLVTCLEVTWVFSLNLRNKLLKPTFPCSLQSAGRIAFEPTLYGRSMLLIFHKGQLACKFLSVSKHLIS